MPINRNAMLRYQVLDRCFRNPGRKYCMEDLLGACNAALGELEANSTGVKRRQLYDDLRFMESEQGWSIPLERYKEGRKVYFRYADLSFSINNQPLNESEALQLQSALLILSRFKGIPQFDWINEMIIKLESSSDLKPGAHYCISFDQNEYLKGREYIGELFSAIYYHKPLDIEYKSFKATTPTTKRIHPYHLKEYNNRWFLFGYSEWDEKISNLALDRILSITEVHSSPYVENTFVDFEEYFDDLIGVTRKPDDVPEKVILWIDSDLAPYILTKPLHGSQKRIRSNEDEENAGLTISINVVPNYELEQTILHYGEKAKVISPEWLREKLLIRLSKAAESYTMGY